MQTMQSTEPKLRRFYGFNASIATLRARPHEVQKIYIDRERPDAAEIAALAEQSDIQVRMVADVELGKLTDSHHHQGVAIETVAPADLSWDDFLRQEFLERELVLILDGVENPHNVGAIVRTCAHFGVRFILGEKRRLGRLTPAAVRTAEGGAETVRLSRFGHNLRDTATALRDAGFAIVAAHGGESKKMAESTDFYFPARTALVMGAEVEGLSLPWQDFSDHLVKVPGTGAVESLNVSVAAAVLMHEFCRQS